jgi:hypothetical protein
MKKITVCATPVKNLRETSGHNPDVLRNRKTLFPDRFLHPVNNVCRNVVHIMSGFGMVDKFPHHFLVGASLCFKPAIDPDIFARN